MPSLPTLYVDKLDVPTCTQAFEAMRTMGSTQVPANFWLVHIFEHFARAANKDNGWDYEFGPAPVFQFIEHTVGNDSNWRIDSPPLSGQPTDRKVTVMCLLNDPSEYVGGGLIVRLGQEHIPPLHRGVLIAFPSILEYKITPVLSGVRCSAMGWFSGPRFK